MQQFIESSALTRLLANVFIFFCLLACIFVAIVEVLRGEPVNPLVYTMLSSGVVYGFTLLGAHVGAVLALTPSPPMTPLPIEKQNTVSVPAIRKGDLP